MSASSGRDLEAPHRAPVLTYHSLDTSRSVISIDPRAFDTHLRGLARRGYTGVSLGRLVAGWQGEGELPQRPVALTFDDGFENFYDCAAPLLSELGFGATVFAVAGHLGGFNDWHQPPEITRLPLMSLARLRELAEAGFEVGSHSVTHPWLTELAADDLEREVHDSRRMLEDGLGQPVHSFAYPFGASSPAVRASVSRAYRSACSVRLAVARPSDNAHRLPRLDMYYFRGGLTRHLPGTRSGSFYLALRALGRRVRGRLG